MRVPTGFHRVFAAAFAASILLPSASAAQQLDPGTRLRVTTDDGITVGTLHARPADSLVLATSAGRIPYSLTDVDRIERSLGRKGNARKGALIGAGAMGLVGVLAIVSAGDDDGVGEDWGGVIASAALPGFLAVGAGVGALVGAVWQTEKWGEVRLGVQFPTGAR